MSIKSFTTDAERQAYAKGRADAVRTFDQSMKGITAQIETKALRDAADTAEFEYRSMSFHCGTGTSKTKLHPVGDWLRDRADQIEKGEIK